MNRNSVRLLAVAASLSLAGCGESTSVVMGELSQAEAQELAGVVLGATFNSTGSVPQPAQANGLQTVEFAFSTQIDGPVDCPLGGMVNVAAELEVSGDTDTEGGTVSYQMTQIHDACVVASDDDQVFTLWGNPSMNVAFEVNNNGQGLVEWQGSIQGIIDWETDGREGSCSIEMEFDGTQQVGTAAAAASMVGTACGFNIDQSVSIG
jgi:hypothetical protein